MGEKSRNIEIIHEIIHELLVKKIKLKCFLLSVKIKDTLAQDVISSELRLQISLILLKRIHRDTAGITFPSFIFICHES